MALFIVNLAHRHHVCQNPLPCIVLDIHEPQKTFYNNQATTPADGAGSLPCVSPAPGAALALWQRMPAAPAGHPPH